MFKSKRNKERPRSSRISEDMKSKDIIRLKKPKKKSLYKKIILTLIGLIALFAIFFVAKTYFSIKKVSVKNITGGSLFLSNESKDTKTVGLNGGRINILVVGIGGKNHPGGLLADTIMVASIDPVNKSIAFLSVPRDLYVKYPKGAIGAGKINSVYSYGETHTKTIPGGGGALLKQSVANILDVPINYYIRVDFGGFENIVDALGGVTIDVPKAINDPSFPANDTIHYDPFYITSGTHHMNGKTALKYARSRESTSDFDRSKRQQEVLVAMKEQALTLGVLANPIKMVKIIGLVGNHVQTDLQTDEMEQLFGILKGVNSNSITNKVLDNSPTGPLKSVSMNGYYLYPKLGRDNYSALAAIAQSMFTNPYLIKENARVSVLNASGISGKATDLSDDLANQKFNVGTIDNAPKIVAKTVIYDTTDGKNPVTIGVLAKKLSASVSTNIPHEIESIAPNADVIIVLGRDYNARK